MKKRGLLTTGFMLFCLGWGWAQNKMPKAYAQAVPRENAIQIKWIVTTPIRVQYHILRRVVGEKTFKKVSEKPLQAITSNELKGPGAVAEARRNFLDFTQKWPTTKDEVQLFLQLFGMNAYTDNEFARAAGMYYKDNTVVAGKTYEYAVSAVFNGKEYSWAMSSPVRAGDYQPLVAPTGLKIVQQKTRQIALSWDIRTDVLAYNVYRRRENGGEIKLNKKPVVVVDALNGKRPSTQFTDSDSTLKVGETYYYHIAALDPFVNAGEQSQAVWLTVKDMDLPAGAADLRGRIDKLGVRLSWKPSSSRDCIGYRLLRGTAINKPFQPVLPRLLAPSDTTFLDETAVEGSTYYYYLRTEDQAGNTVNTSPIQVTHPDLTPPALPAGLTVQTDTMGHVALNWRANQETDLKGYFVYRALEDKPDNYAQLQLKPLAGTVFRDTLPRTNRNVFYYRITAVDQSDNESVPALQTVRLPDRLAPRAPMLLPPVFAADSVRLEWTSPDADEVRIYQVMRRNESDRQPTFQVIGRTANRRFTDQKVSRGLYSYAILATDSAGNQSKPSLPKIVELVGKNPLTAPKDVKVRLDEREKKLLVSWSQPPQPADFAGYRVLARDQGETFRAVTPLLTEARAELTDWETGANYEIAVVAISQTGQQLNSEIVKATPRK
ncbi:fibronectin type III domain-containing protein [Larkinella rosea]|uniref:Fibronectin type-III domain-containing protein n=1 Tax=Larkinella rosea TaxID=2025312 RepID=A0A3P1BUX0_9BACT|nr:fibronectin type III domain-containing protein [Larkinella rosea]RRB04900.1 hypothetical protein EHT25_15695 [Larkinella rosea]